MVKASEIDDLFAKKPTSTAPAKKRKTSAVDKTAAEHKTKPGPTPTTTSSAVPNASEPRRAKKPKTVQIVQDTSSTAQAPILPASSIKRKKSTAAVLPGDVAQFTDSRGTSRKKTEDGLAIYSEAELKLDQGGDTPLCPFDCDCCEFHV